MLEIREFYIFAVYFFLPLGYDRDNETLCLRQGERRI